MTAEELKDETHFTHRWHQVAVTSDIKLRPDSKFPTGHSHSRRMEGGGKQSRLLSRLLGKLRGDHRLNLLDDKRDSFSSAGITDESCCDKALLDEDVLESLVQSVQSSDTMSPAQPPPAPGSTDTPPSVSPGATSSMPIDDKQFAANIDQRYGGQYLTPEQLPEFCDQLHNLVQVIRNIQSYAKITGEYPKILEHRLQVEAEEVAVLAAEARNARNAIDRTRVQRRAVRTQRRHLISHLTTLRETELRELESTVRLSDRKLFKTWETLKDSKDPAAFDPLLEEVQNKQIALESLMRLIGNRKQALSRGAAQSAIPQPLPPPPLPRNNEDKNGASASNEYRREGRRAGAKRRRKEAAQEPRSVPLSGEPSHHGTWPQEPRSVPLSGEPSHHGTWPQVTLHIQGLQGTDDPPRHRVSSTGAVALSSIEMPPSRDGGGRDIMFFTSN
ncbi:hypothetical protein NE865_03100 [Phthorimaea operculella]|nr:hypothetical protein NE865_03100 [Phthorimaea operculella]